MISDMKELNKKSYFSYFEIIASMLIFGTVGAVRRGMLFPSGFVAMARGFIGAVVIVGFMLLTGKKPSFKSIKENALPLILSGAFIGINWIFLFESFRYTTVAVATICYYMAPVFVVLLSPFVIRERVGAVKIFTVLLAVFGMILVSDLQNLKEAGGALGIILALLAAVFYALVTITNKKLKNISSLDRTLVQLFVAAVTVLPYTLTMEKTKAEMFDTKSLVLLFVLGVLHTGVAYLMFFSSIERLPAVTVSLFGYIDPVFAVIISVVLLGEELSLLGAIGAVIVVVSMIASELFDFISHSKKR